MSAVEKRPHTRSPWREAFEMIANHPQSAESACELTRNAKGVPQFTVTVRGGTAAENVAEARRLFDELAVAYPYANGAGE